MNPRSKFVHRALFILFVAISLLSSAAASEVAYNVVLASPEQHLVEVQIPFRPVSLSTNCNFPFGMPYTRSATSLNL